MARHAVVTHDEYATALRLICAPSVPPTRVTRCACVRGIAVFLISAVVAPPRQRDDE